MVAATQAFFCGGISCTRLGTVTEGCPGPSGRNGAFNAGRAVDAHLARLMEENFTGAMVYAPRGGDPALHTT